MVATNAGVGVVYAVAGIATLSFGKAVGPELSTVLWIGSGIALCMALLVPYPVWPGVGAGAFVATLSDGSPLVHGLVTAAANGGEIWLATTLLGQFRFSRRFSRVRDVLLFVGLACGLAAAIPALVSVTSLVATGGTPSSSFGRIWVMWWLTHGMGMLLVVPPTLIVRARRSELTDAGVRQAALILGGIAFVSWVSFLAPSASLRAELFFLPFLLLLLAAVRGNAVVASLGGFILTSMAIAGAFGLRGPFVSGGTNASHILT